MLNGSGASDTAREASRLAAPAVHRRHGRLPALIPSSIFLVQLGNGIAVESGAGAVSKTAKRAGQRSRHERLSKQGLTVGRRAGGRGARAAPPAATGRPPLGSAAAGRPLRPCPRPRGGRRQAPSSRQCRPCSFLPPLCSSASGAPVVEESRARRDGQGGTVSGWGWRPGPQPPCPCTLLPSCPAPHAALQRPARPPLARTSISLCRMEP